MNSSIGRTTNRLQIVVVETTSLSKTTRRNKVNSSGIKFATASTNVRIFKFPHLQTLASPNAHIFKCIFSKLSSSKNSHLYELSPLWTLISDDSHLIVYTCLYPCGVPRPCREKRKLCAQHPGLSRTSLPAKFSPSLCYFCVKLIFVNYRAEF